MTIERAVRLLAGVMVLLATALVYWVSPWWLLLHCFIGLNLIQSSFTGFCPPEILFRRLGMRSGTGS